MKKLMLLVVTLTISGWGLHTSAGHCWNLAGNTSGRQETPHRAQDLEDRRRRMERHVLQHRPGTRRHGNTLHHPAGIDRQIFDARN